MRLGQALDRFPADEYMPPHGKMYPNRLSLRIGVPDTLDNLPEADKSKMDFGSGGSSKAKAWRDIWGAGQGVGTVHDIPSVEELVMRMEDEYQAARQRLTASWRKRARI